MDFTEYYAPDGTVFKFDRMKDRFLVSETGFGMPSIKLIEQRSPMQHGKTIFDYRLEPRVIQLIFRENACSRDEYWDNRANILSIIKPSKPVAGWIDLGTLRKIMPDGSSRDIDVIVEQGPEFRAREPGRWEEWLIHEVIRFIAPDPIFYNPAEYVSASASSFSITYAGTWKEYPRISILGPLQDPVLTNTATGEKIDLSGYHVAAGESIVISLVTGRKTITSSIAGDIISYLSLDSDLTTFHLGCAPECAGGVNPITVGGSGATGATLISFTYYNRYIGI